MTGAQRDRNIKLGSGKKKATPSNESTGWSRPAEGRRETAPVQRKSPPQSASPRRNEPRRNNDNRRGSANKQGNRPARPQQNSPLMEEQWARVIDHDLANNVVVAVSESKLLLCRLKPKAGIDQLLVTARVYIGEDSSKRTHIAQVLGMTNLSLIHI